MGWEEQLNRRKNNTRECPMWAIIIKLNLNNLKLKDYGRFN